MKKIGLISSSGGHLLQLLILKEFWGGYDRFWVTFNKVDAVSQLKKERVYFCYYPTNRNGINLIRNFFLAVKLILIERPDMIISTGAAVAVPFFYIAKIFGIKTAYLEVYDRINSPTLTGRIVYPVADHFFVQWEEQKKFYPGAVCVGELL